MFLAPRQLQRAGMTGDVPYYGGRLTPWHIQGINEAARHRAAPPPASHALPPAPAVPPAPAGPVLGARVPVLPVTQQRGVADPARAHAALRQLLDDGVITGEEYEGIRGRIR